MIFTLTTYGDATSIDINGIGYRVISYGVERNASGPQIVSIEFEGNGTIGNIKTTIEHIRHEAYTKQLSLKELMRGRI